MELSGVVGFQRRKRRKKKKKEKIHRRSQGRLEPELKQDIDSVREYAVRNERARAKKKYMRVLGLEENRGEKIWRRIAEENREEEFQYDEN